MDQITIRTAKENDFMDISLLAGKCMPMVTERNSIFHIFTKFFQNTVFIAETNENKIKRIIGFLIGFISQSDSSDAYIHLLCVDSDFRGKGIAYQLVMEFLKYVKKMNCRSVYLITNPVNHNAIQFYQKLGFKIFSESDVIEMDKINAVKDYNGPGEHMVVFKKDI